MIVEGNSMQIYGAENAKKCVVHENDALCKIESWAYK